MVYFGVGFGGLCPVTTTVSGFPGDPTGSLFPPLVLPVETLQKDKSTGMFIGARTPGTTTVSQGSGHGFGTEVMSGPGVIVIGSVSPDQSSGKSSPPPDVPPSGRI